MKAGLIQSEPERLKLWEKEDLAQKILDARKDAELFVLHDGPPFANGDVHMGTGLNKILKDFIVKSKSMAGFRAPFIPGWDCHGLPIEYKVVKDSQGLEPAEVRRRSEKMARKFIDVQRRQFKRLGVLGDWENPYLTLNPGYEAEILRVFAKIVEKGLVYRRKKPVFWSSGAQTALAEAEVEYQEKDSNSVYTSFPLASGPLAGDAAMAIWTTTPWTLPANLALAVGPALEYVQARVRGPELPEQTLILAKARVAALVETCGLELVGTPTSVETDALLQSSAHHPFLDRTVPILGADFVTLETGTGVVHIAPGHGEDDYRLGNQAGLSLLSPVDDHGCFTEEVGVPEWEGKYVFDANPEVIKLLREKERLLGAEVYRHSYPHCWRSKTPVIFRAVDQFFIDVGQLREAALQAIDQVQWLPHWGRNRIRGTVESRPDWCISRQRTWGVPLPVFYDSEGESRLEPEWIRKVADLVEKEGTNLWFELPDQELAERLGLPEGLTRRQDTLDVWIDSGVSHQAVLGTHPELRAPADVYIEATDQHRGWFQSSLLLAVALDGKAPYKEVITHGFVVDMDGRKISKSAEYQKPTDAEHFVNRHGADVVRLWVSCLNYTDEVPFSEEIFERLADTYRRIRNTLRILLGNLADYPEPEPPPHARIPTPVDEWILSRYQQVVRTCREAYAEYEFHKVYHALNSFCAVDLSSLYIDITKDRLYCDAPDSPRRRATQWAMKIIFDGMTRLLAPILAFTADEAWRHSGRSGSVHLECFPEMDPVAESPAAAEVDRWLKWRNVISQSLEEARRNKVINASLDAEVTLELPATEIPAAPVELLEEFFIVSDLIIKEGEEIKATTRLSEHAKCPRCWRKDSTVGSHPTEPELCLRCAEALPEPQ